MSINLEELYEVEQTLKKIVEDAPTNVKARRGLADCLVLLAMFRAGQEAMGSDNIPDTPQPLNPSGKTASRSSTELLKEHLWHLRVLEMLPGDSSNQKPKQEEPLSRHLRLSAGLESDVQKKHEDALRRMLADIRNITSTGIPNKPMTRN